MSRQTIVAVALTLAVVTLNSYGRTALAARPIAVALTNQAEKAQAFDALAKLVRPIILLYPMPWVVSSDVFCRKRDRPPKTESVTRNQTGPFLCLTR